MRGRARQPCTRPALQAAVSAVAAAPARSASPLQQSPHSDAARAVDEIQLPQYDTVTSPRLDLLVAGGGPAGLAVAERVSAAGYQVRSESC